MSVIVCATGNGSQSRQVQARAIAVARQQQKRLIFVHVVDVRQVPSLDESLREAAEAELSWLGSAILRLAQDRAHRQGVHAETVVLSGDVQSALKTFLSQHPIDLLLMGQVTNPAMLELARYAQDNLGIPVQMVAGRTE